MVTLTAAQETSRIAGGAEGRMAAFCADHAANELRVPAERAFV